MTLFIKLIGLIIMIAGGFYIFAPAYIKKSIEFWIEGRRKYVAAVINLIIGIMLVMAASGASIPTLVYLFGIVALLKAFTVVVMSHQKFTALLTYWSEKSATFLFYMGIIALALGLLLIYSA